MQVIKIDLKRIDQSKCFRGKNGAVYLDAVVFENDQPDQYGNTQVIYQSVSKEDREKGIKGAIVGNGKIVGSRPSPPSRDPASPRTMSKTVDHGEDDIPF